MHPRWAPNPNDLMVNGLLNAGPIVHRAARRPEC
jgi:hypothetical protein